MSALGILTDRSRGRGPEWESNPDIRLDPESIAKVRVCSSCVCDEERSLTGPAAAGRYSPTSISRSKTGPRGRGSSIVSAEYSFFVLIVSRC